MACEHQDAVAVLQLTSAAIAEYGRPDGMVSDNGSVFTSEAYEGLLRTLGIEVRHIEKGKPWQNLIEAQFKVELRLADARFEQATPLEEIQEQHAAFVELFNTTPHWAHREREDGLRTPVDVLRWVRGPDVDQDTLQRALRRLQWELDEEQWRKIARRPYERRAISDITALRQLVLITSDPSSF
jgi:transposase InsO family protein